MFTSTRSLEDNSKPGVITVSCRAAFHSDDTSKRGEVGRFCLYPGVGSSGGPGFRELVNGGGV